jgi:hypothetical protein
MEKEEIHEALMRLGEVLRDRRVTGEIDIFWGAAIVSGFDFRRATQDVDSLVTLGHGQVMQAAQEVGKKQHLPPNWLNEQVTIYLSKHKDSSVVQDVSVRGAVRVASVVGKSRIHLSDEAIGLWSAFRRQPAIYARVHEEYRRALIRRFPYAVASQYYNPLLIRRSKLV